MGFELRDWMGLRLEVLGDSLVPRFSSEGEAIQFAVTNYGQSAKSGQLNKIQWKGYPAIWKQHGDEIIIESVITVHATEVPEK